jgi:hypothetical protein
MSHIGLEIAFALSDGTLCKVKAQTETAPAVDMDTLFGLFEDAAARALAVAKLSA